MNVLFDVGHPAHVHLFKNFIRHLQQRNHKVVITSREKDITNNLLNYYGFEYTSLSSSRRNLTGMFIELMTRDWQILKLHAKHRFDLAFGTSVSIAHLSLLSRVKSYNFNEDDDDVVPLYTKITYPFTTRIVNPRCLKFKRWKKKRLMYDSYHELAYLHPDNFIPDPGILKELGLAESDPFFMVRLSALKAHHDKGVAGLSAAMQVKMIEMMKAHGRVFITSEEKLSPQFEEYQFPIAPEKIHSALYYARMFVGDSQTMSAEAAVLGTYAIRYNSFVGRISYLEELEHQYGLTFGFRPGQEQDMYRRLSELLNQPEAKREAARKRDRMLADKIDLTQWMIDLFDNHLTLPN